MDPATDLPDDPTILKQLVLELRRELESQKLLGRQLQHQMEQLMRRFLGRKSEKLDPNQLQLLFAELQELGLREESEEAASSESDDEDEEPPSESPRRRRRGAHGRRRLPKHLPRERQEHQLSEDELGCFCGGQQTKIGEKISEQLEYRPAQMVVIEHVRFLYGCQDCEETITIAEKPPQPIDKGLAGPGLLAQVVTSKYGDHLPLYRLEGIFDRLGVSLSRQTMCDWIASSADLLRPLVELMKVDLLRSKKIHTDDTSVPVLDPSLGQTRRGRLWVYLGHEPHDHIVFDYTPSRERDGPAAFLEGFSGYLQADAYSAYDGIYAGGEVIEVACWAHARRKFIENTSTDRGDPFTALAFITQLYQIERKAKDLSSCERRDLRQEHSVPVLTAFKEWLDEKAQI
jgi:transposase